ncbi:profilin [Sporodiniella umbellata]|nr:profilin [Sporodiniella umbellata]
MSWQSYVDTNLVGTGSVSQASIYGLTGDVWATSPGFQLRPSEVQEILSGFQNPEKIRANGVHVAGEKYFVILTNERSIYGKKQEEGICIVKTDQTFLVGTYKDGIQPGNCAKVVEALADYLISVNF